MATCAVKFVALPVMGAAAIKSLASLGLLPANPMCLLALLIQCVMPPAQGLAVQMQLQPSTQKLAPSLARLLLQTYIISVVPVTLWMPVFYRIVGMS